MFEFSALGDGTGEISSNGLVLRKLSATYFEIEAPDGTTMEFELREGLPMAAMKAVRSGTTRLHLLYGSSENLAEIVPNVGAQVRFSADEKGRIREVRLFDSGSTGGRVLASYEYDPTGRLAIWQDALGSRERYEYSDATAWMSKRTDRRGYSFHYRYDEQGRCVRRHGDDGLDDVSLRYEPLTRRTVATYADGASFTYVYDEGGVVTEIVEPLGGVCRFRVDEAGRVVEEIDPAGNVTKVLHDANGGVVGRLSPLGFVFPPLEVEPNPPEPLEYELPTTPLEWEFGGLVDPTAMKTSTPHDAVFEGYPQDAIDQALDRGDGTTPPANRTPASPARDCDAMGRVLTERDENGLRQKWTYDPNGNVVEHQDRDGSIYRSVYASRNLLRERIDPIGATTRFEYSLREEITRFTDPGGNVSEYRYDKNDRLVEVWRHGRLKERYGYDATDGLVEKTGGDGRPLLTMKIAPGNLESECRLASGEGHYYTHDDRGNIVSAATDESTVSLSYDPWNRVLTDERDGRGVVHALDRRFLASTTYFGRFVVRYQWSDEHTLAVVDPTGGLHRIRFGGRGFVSRELGNGSRDLVAHDPNGRFLTRVVLGPTVGTRPWVRKYRYSTEGDLLSCDDSWRGNVNFEFDSAHRLRTEILPTGERYLYKQDAVGNLLEKPGLRGVEIQPGNRLSRANGDTFAYDDRGNLSSRSGPAGQVRYAYDSMDRLVRCEVNGEQWSAGYDALSRRIRKAWKGGTVEFFWDDFRLAAEVRADGPLRLYLYPDRSALQPFMFVDYAEMDADPAAGTSYFIFANQIGSPEHVEDAAGRTVWTARVDPFGVIDISDSTVDLALRFPGHYHDVETGLHYNRFRYYVPELGRYLQPDPLGIAGGANLYGYPSNPLTRVDLDGLCGATRKGGKSKKGPKKEEKLTNKDKPKGKAWDTAPNFDTWQKPPPEGNGGTIKANRNGTVTYTNANGVSVKYNKKGYPDFSPHLGKVDGIKTVQIPKTKGDRPADFRAANAAARKRGGDPENFVGKKAPDGHRWHHHEDGTTMQLVPTDIHEEFRHAGGVSGSK